jgi:hypothetical protein
MPAARIGLTRMNKIMGWITFTAVIVALIIGTYGVLTSVSVRDQLRVTQSKLSVAQSQLSAARANINGTHRDLITCGDLQQVETMIDGIVISQGNVGPVEFVSSSGSIASSLPLPLHCINQ